MSIPENTTLLTGDIILVSRKDSAWLVKLQKSFVSTTVSSHVVIAQAELACIDAKPKDGVRIRFILDVFDGVEPTWRVIRNKQMTQDDRDNIIKASAFFQNQSYLVHPIHRMGKSKSYCSELARKIFHKANVSLAVPQNGLVIPGHFDLLLQNNPDWVDVTSEIQSWLEVVKANEARFRGMSDAMISGLKLNRKRFDDRKTMREKLLKLKKSGNLSQDKYSEAISTIDNVDKIVNFKFWDVK